MHSFSNEKKVQRVLKKVPLQETKKKKNEWGAGLALKSILHPGIFGGFGRNVFFLGNIHIGTETLGNRSFRNREPGNRFPGTIRGEPGNRFPGTGSLVPVWFPLWFPVTGYWVLAREGTLTAYRLR